MGSEYSMKKARFTIHLKLQLLVILLVLIVSLGTAMLAYIINVNQCNRYVKRMSYNSAENFAALTDPYFFSKIRATAESEEFQTIRKTAEQTKDDTLIENYLKEKGLWE